MHATKDEITGRWTLHGVEPSNDTFTRICNMLQSGQKFKFARYGDGEINCMDGKQGQNCDGHKYFPDLGERLKKTLKNPDYMIGIQPLSVSHLPNSVNKYFSKIDQLYDADAIHSASIDGRMVELFDAISERYIILVGPSHLMNVFNSVHIVIPDKNCWLNYKEIKEQLDFHIEGSINPVVVLCCGMMAEVLISEIDCTAIDVGSAFDPYCGVLSRKYHHKLKL